MSINWLPSPAWILGGALTDSDRNGRARRNARARSQARSQAAAINAGRRYVRANGTTHLGPPASVRSDCRDIAATAKRYFQRCRDIVTLPAPTTPPTPSAPADDPVARRMAEHVARIAR